MNTHINAKSTGERAPKLEKSGWLKNENPPEVRIVLRDAGPRHGAERSVGRQQCATVVAECTAAEARGRGHPKAWNDPSEQIGNTVCIPRRQKRSGALYVNCSRTAVIYSGDSDRRERDRPHVPGNIKCRLSILTFSLPTHKDYTPAARHLCPTRTRPWCMGFIARFL
jgi:hypothetical protein